MSWKFWQQEVTEDVVQIPTSSTNGIDGPPFMFLGFKRGNNVSIKAFPPLLQNQRMQTGYICQSSLSSNSSLFTWKIL